MEIISAFSAEILDRVVEAGACPEGAFTPEELERVQSLTRQGLLTEERFNERFSDGSTTADGFYFAPLLIADRRYRISPEGKDALAEYDRTCIERAKARKQQKFQNRVSVADVVVPAVTFILGLVVEYGTGIIGIIVSLLTP